MRKWFMLTFVLSLVLDAGLIIAVLRGNPPSWLLVPVAAGYVLFLWVYSKYRKEVGL